MQIVSSTSTERNLAVEFVIEDIPGGGTIMQADFPSSSTGMKDGALVGVDSNGIYHIVKTAMLVNPIVTASNAMIVYNNHEFKVGDYIGISASAFASGALITAIAASGAGCDVITMTWAGAAVAASGIMVQASGAGLSPYKYTPAGITTIPVDVSAASGNQGVSIMVRGRVRQNSMPYYVDTTIKNLLPLIRFV
jgi:hypothetical protein